MAHEFTMSAKYEGKCTDCGYKIVVGSWIIYDPLPSRAEDEREKERMKCSQCGKELCQYGSCHNANCVAREDEACICEGDWCEEEDFMQGLCPDCIQGLCLRCGKCCTPACEAEECDCVYTW